jgi:P27 family predicted phage terminase small subunit
MKGRKPRPTKLKILEGEKNKNRINRLEPKPVTLKATCPRYLNDVAKAAWNRLYPELHSMGLMAKIDRDALAAYCQAYARYVKYERIVAEKGELYKTAAGNVIISPALAVANRALEQMRQFMAEFGLTPSSRARIIMEPPGELTALEKVLKTRLN